VPPLFSEADDRALMTKQRIDVVVAERPAGRHVNHLRQRQRRINRIDAADDIVMLRRLAERRQILTAERDEDATRRLPQRMHRRGGVAHLDPAVAGDRGPWSTPQRHAWHFGVPRGGGGIRRDDAGVGMRGIDQRVDALAHQIVGEAGGAAIPAAAHRHRLAGRRDGAAGKRQRDLKVGAACQPLREHSRFRGAAENEDAWHVAP